MTNHFPETTAASKKFIRSLTLFILINVYVAALNVAIKVKGHIDRLEKDNG